jgi:predicted phosphodiesterase
MQSALVLVEPQNFVRIAVIGDLHGDYKTLTALLKLVDLTVDLLVFLGD